MTQGDIMKILVKLDEDEWISTKDLAKILKINSHTVTANLLKMRAYNEAESRRMPISTQNPQQEHRLTWKGRQ